MAGTRTGNSSHMASREERKLAGGGGRLVAIGAPLVVIGVVLALLLDATALGVGVAVAMLGAIPVVVGLTLLVSAGVEQHARKDRPFA
jgi:uncharacterized membrane protein